MSYGSKDLKGMLQYGEKSSKPSGRSLYEQRKKYSNSNFIMDDRSQYYVNHLTTFPLGPGEETQTVEESVKKLKALDSKGRIWTQEMLLQVNSSAISLVDIESKDELETYPLDAVKHCDSLLDKWRFDSILILICQEAHQANPEIHFFQCSEVGADLIKSDINSAITDLQGGGRRERPNALRFNQEKMNEQSTSPPSPPIIRAPQAPAFYNPMSTGHRAVPSSPTKAATPPMASAELNGTGGVPQDISEQRTARDVAILNHTFDDIEAFMVRLQKTAEAFKILDQRKKSRMGKKRTSKESGEGLLTLRARPPTQEEFIDVFQKYKYSFSLLARVKNHIVNPSATELIHFLFSPLDTMVQTVGQHVARSVTTPFLTNDAVHFLKNTLNQTEMAQWQSLGDYWTKPRLEWPTEHWGAPYYIQFRSGWQPDDLDPNGALWEDPVELQHKHELLRMQQSGPQTAPVKQSNGTHNVGNKPMKCSYDFVARNSNELSVLSGEVVEVLDNSKRWWKVQNQSGQVGYVPFNILEPVPAQDVVDSSFLYAEVNKGNQQTPKGTPPPTLPKRVSQPHPEQVGWDSNLENLGVTQKERERHTQINVMNEELLLRIANGRTAQQKSFQVQKTLDTSVPLDYTSSPSEVKTWLEAKGFSQMTVNSLGILTGAQLFSLQKDELRSVSPEEGTRVYSQIMVQKSLLEDNRSVTELEAIMEKQKKKVDSEIKMSTL
ncbi:epidermal growth factor receptor kinase substrate 8-like protein 1 isoform X1 [Hemiscyllium ocellatum]|uniref:epidermal growth factor receptor kinase substrate 8-like protein 1 isoform X1 n=2 Tax=Hemiscyllium ocellatum TaxID=170820 RepID=UPI002966567B|nr:epidermal growth factor receptor kinase substrate 8-like protein 1 isoform X1 [Hemiscyllium ocellatum]